MYGTCQSALSAHGAVIRAHTLAADTVEWLQNYARKDHNKREEEKGNAVIRFSEIISSRVVSLCVRHFI